MVPSGVQQGGSLFQAALTPVLRLTPVLLFTVIVCLTLTALPVLATASANPDPNTASDGLSSAAALADDSTSTSSAPAQSDNNAGTSAIANAFRPGTATTASGLPITEGGRGRKPVSVSGRLTSGINEAFQLTLGGLFSDGVNFQNTATVDVNNLLTDGGTLRFSGILHLDTGGSGRDWIGAVNYIQPLLTWESGKLVGTVGFHVWQFPSVLNGKTDTVVDSGLTWVQSGPISFTADANVKTLATGPGRIGVGGQIYYFRGTTSHPIIRKPNLSLALVHGPSYTYSNRFYGVHGHRVIRYEAGAVLQYGNWGIDAMYRPQLALQRGIPENRFWGFNIFYVFN